MKKTKQIIEAERALSTKLEELNHTRERLKWIEAEVSNARATVRIALEAADAGLPRCSLVTIDWRSGVAKPAGDVVIVRCTPGGLLVVRKAGEENELRFKWSKFSGVYRQAEKARFTSETRELREVPPEFMPALGGRDVAPRADGGS